MKIQLKLTILFVVLSAAVLAAAGAFSTVTLEDYFRSRIVDEMRTQAQEMAYVLRALSEHDTSAYEHLQELAHASNVRLTLIAADGTVLFESELSEAAHAEMQNHLGRPEVQEALRDRVGTNVRTSATLDLQMLYLATRIDDPFPERSGFDKTRFLRVGIPLTQVTMLMDGIRAKIIVTSVIVLLVVIGAALFIARRLASPIERMDRIAAEIRKGDLSRRLPVTSHDEIGELSQTLNGMIDRLNEDITQLRKLERVRSEFLGNVSHELRTPIFAIQGMLETLLQGGLEDPAVSRDFVDRALHNTKRLNTLLSDLIEISRIESGDMKMSFRYFPVYDFLCQTAAELQPLAGQKNIALTVGKDCRAADVLGDRERLRQALINVIDNALKYTPAGGRVEISCRLADGDAIIAVSDNGVGIAAEHLSRIFERFYRVDKERSREAGGTGLGLAIVKHIIEAHGSTVDVKSEVGKGTTFSFRLPAYHSREETA